MLFANIFRRLISISTNGMYFATTFRFIRIKKA